MIIGHNRSGKTSLKKSLIGEKFDPEQNSTQGVEVDPSFCQITTSMWRTDGKTSADKGNSASSCDYHIAKVVVQELENSLSKEQPQESSTRTCFEESDDDSYRAEDEATLSSSSNNDEVPPEILARGKEACDAYHKALKEGKTHDRRIPLMIIGHNRSGKTVLKKSLIGEKFDP